MEYTPHIDQNGCVLALHRILYHTKDEKIDNFLDFKMFISFFFIESSIFEISTPE